MSDTRLVLASPGRASDAAYLAAADVATIAAELHMPYRLIGGNAVGLLVAAYGVAHLVPARETADADFGAEYPVLADPRFLEALHRYGYAQIEGNRFSREHTLPAPSETGTLAYQLVVDVLAPSFLGHLRTNRQVGALTVDEIPGLNIALARPGLPVAIEVRLSSGLEIAAELMLPDVVSAICMKAYAYAGRFSDRDAVDLWRLLEAAAASGTTAETWPTGPTAAACGGILHQHFGRIGSAGPARASALPQIQTRIRALVGHVIGALDRPAT